MHRPGKARRARTGPVGPGKAGVASYIYVGAFMIALGNAEDRKSSYSAGQGNCAVVGSDRPDSVRVRDSKIPNGRPVRVSPAAFAAFTRSL